MNDKLISTFGGCSLIDSCSTVEILIVKMKIKGGGRLIGLIMADGHETFRSKHPNWEEKI
jgi:hypothetical protein